MGMLGELGLTDLEEEVYLAVLDQPGSAPGDLAMRCAITTPKVRRTLATLQQLGLITRLTDPAPGYAAIRPDLAIGVLIRQREERLAQLGSAMTELTKRFHAASRGDTPAELIEVVHSPDAIHQRWLQLQRSARSEIRALDKPPYIAPGNPAEPGLLATGVRYRTVCDRAALDYPGKIEDLWEAADAGEDCRIATDVPIKLFLADDRMALAPLHQPQDVESAVIVHPSALLDALGALFESVWQRSLPLAAFRTGTSSGATALSDEQRRLLQLLAAGYTDEAIAHKLDRGYRTVQRHIGILMDTLSAQTRFQLGLRAAALLDPDDR
jgi:DNA-binding CsgD family transcriptional regulator/predicted transcriptional regulator